LRKQWEGEGFNTCAILQIMSLGRARRLRVMMTDAERRLWSALRSRRLQGFKFRRQHPLGNYILDFACIEHRLVIEADGGQHADNKADAHRTAWLESQGWRVIRFWNNDILANTEGVLDTILRFLTED
jgi:very-short-patch-repair endonuclease